MSLLPEGGRKGQAPAFDSTSEAQVQMSLPSGLLEPGRAVGRVDVQDTYLLFCGAPAGALTFTNMSAEPLLKVAAQVNVSPSRNGSFN